MSQIEKLVQMLRNAKAEVRLMDLIRFLEHIGYVKVRQKGSHMHYRKGDEVPISFSTHDGLVKSIYVKEIFKGLGL